jgi:hypothetical protein
LSLDKRVKILPNLRLKVERYRLKTKKERKKERKPVREGMLVLHISDQESTKTHRSIVEKCTWVPCGSLARIDV